MPWQWLALPGVIRPNKNISRLSSHKSDELSTILAFTLFVPRDLGVNIFRINSHRVDHHGVSTGNRIHVCRTIAISGCGGCRFHLWRKSWGMLSPLLIKIVKCAGCGFLLWRKSWGINTPCWYKIGKCGGCGFLLWRKVKVWKPACWYKIGGCGGCGLLLWGKNWGMKTPCS